MKSLQTKIFIFFVLLLLLVQATSFWMITQGNKNQEQQEIANRLNTAKTIFNVQFESRNNYLTAFAETVARDYGIKQSFEDDLRSLLVVMNNHRKRINADLVMAISAKGMVTGQLVVKNNGKDQIVKQGSERDQKFKFERWLDGKPQSHLYELDSSVYQVSLSPMLVGSRIIGWLVFGFEINEKLAKEFYQITDFHTNFVLRRNDAGADWILISTSSSNPDIILSKRILANNTPKDYIATSEIVDDTQHLQLGLVMYTLRSDVVEIFQEQWWQVLLLTMVVLLLSLLIAYLISASITRPIKRLVQQAKIVASGDYHQSVNIYDNNELGQLAQEFNLMQEAVLSREKAIIYQANHDTLTDLPNRNVLNDKIKQLIEKQCDFTVFHLNLCRLKDVNETLGYDVGDWFIQMAANRLARLNDFIVTCYIGAGEFILLANNNVDTSYEYYTRLIEQALEEKCEYQGISFQMQVRIGIASVPDHSEASLKVLQKADIALHSIHKTTQRVQIYQQNLDINSIERLNLINDLKEAIGNEQLELYYQPKINLSTNIITHVEALVRWNHPHFGMVSPDNFIHIAEQIGQINELTKWVFINALKQYNVWFDQGLEINMAVNISAVNLKDQSFYQSIKQSLITYDVPSEKITLEVTESAVVEDPEYAIELLKKFNELGLKISIDDYGTGYSSLAQLKQLPVHELKIDKSFVQNLATDEDDKIIVRSTIELAHNMGLTLVAEGVEDEDTLNWLARHNCELGQGYYISRPKPAHELTPWLLLKRSDNVK